jgi:hypothetical protein
MKNLFNLSSIEKEDILKQHYNEKSNHGSRITEQSSEPINNQQPNSVVNTYTFDGKKTSIQFNSNGTYKSNRPLIGNTKNLSGNWRFVPKSGTGGRIYYTSGGVKDGFIQELGYDLEFNDKLQRLFNDNPIEYNNLPIMTKLLNLKNSTISGSVDTEKPLISQNKPQRCPTGCVRDPNYEG